MGFEARPQFEWKLRTRSLRLGERTLIMAIVNVTPDSFSAMGVLGVSLDAQVETAVAALDAGADVVDLGAESTRPGAEPLSADEEQERLLPVLEAVLRARTAALVSVDTYHATTALAAVRAGAEIVNDVSGLLWDQRMAAVVAEERVGLVLMHTRGRPPEWKTQPALPADEVVPLVVKGLRTQMSVALAAGIEASRIVLDPGFGFGKRGVVENVSLLAGFRTLLRLGRPVLAGVSRKGFLGEVVGEMGEVGQIRADRLNATMAANVAAILGGASIVRVHDVQAAREAAAVADAVLAAS